MGTSVRGKNKLSEARAPVLRSKKRHSQCELPIETEDISRPREERELGFFAVATPQWRAHAPPAHPAAQTSQSVPGPLQAAPRQRRGSVRVRRAPAAAAR